MGRSARRTLAAGAAVVLALCVGAYVFAGASRARLVSHVYDGDTLRLADGTKVRLIGVDAPEVESPYGRGEPYGEESRKFLASLVEGRKVSLTIGDPPVDRYGRTLAYVYVDNVLVNGRIIREGWAEAYRRFPHPMRDLFVAYEREARSKGLGIWAGRRAKQKAGPGGVLRGAGTGGLAQ